MKRRKMAGSVRVWGKTSTALARIGSAVDVFIYLVGQAMPLFLKIRMSITPRMERAVPTQRNR